MQKNIGSTDKIVRYVVAVVLGVLIFAKVVTGVVAIILGIVAAALVITSLISWCGLYTILGINTIKSGGSPQDKGSSGCGCGSH